MNFRFTVVETTLNRVEFRWKWQKFVRASLLLAAIVVFLVLSLGLAILADWLRQRSVATFLLASICVAGFFAWVILLIAMAARTANRQWLAAKLERVDRRLLDRLNTLLFLEPRRGDPQTEAIALRIARQTQSVVAQKPLARPFSSSSLLPYTLAFLLCLATTLFVYKTYAPWDRLLASAPAKVVRGRPEQNQLELPPPGTNTVEQDRPWGEVRITDPGSDLKVTKLDVVPLQIEAAANQTLKTVSWFSTVNGAQDAAHDLPAPAEPRFAVYQPAIYLDELQLADWDVMTYYAKAHTEKSNSYASEVYFLEVRPFREDILKMPGGEGGKAYQSLNEISVLINRQQHIIRQTHQHIQQPPEEEKVRLQDRKKLADAEQDAADSTQHVYARMAAQMENKPIGEALDNLAKAQRSLHDASGRLAANALDQGQGREREALSQLVAARKSFQKAVSDNPGAFDEPKADEASPPVADLSKKLNQMAEFRDETKAAQQFVQKTLEQQRNLEQQAKIAPRNDLPRLGTEEQRLQQALEDFQGQHPRAGQEARNQFDDTQKAMGAAADSLQQRSNDAREATRQATQHLEQLNEAMNQNAAHQQLADAYKLNQMLAQQARTFNQASRPNNQASTDDLQKAAREASQTMEQLKKLAEQEPTRDAFGQPLRDSLNGDKKVELDATLKQLQQQPLDSQQNQQLSQQAGKGLEQVNKAFGESQPQTAQNAQRSDTLKPDGQDGLGQGLAKLESLLKQLEKQAQPPRADQSKQGKEAFYDLQSGMRSRFGDNERGNQLLQHLEQMLKAEGALDPGDLKKLMDELQQFSLESSEQFAKKEDKPEATNIDPARLPPAYRGRIQKYFQKLSER